MGLQQSDLIEVKRTRGKGRGVFARRPIAEGEIIERAPVLVIKLNEFDDEEVGETLERYCFYWGRKTVALTLGYGSLYNHSYQPNATYFDVGQQTKVFKALRDIDEGEEITINYNGRPDDEAPVGFEVR